MTLLLKCLIFAALLLVVALCVYDVNLRRHRKNGKDDFRGAWLDMTDGSPKDLEAEKRKALTFARLAERIGRKTKLTKKARDK